MRRFIAAAAAISALSAAVRAAPPTQFTPPSTFVGEGPLTEAQASEALEAFRHAGPAHPYYLELEFRHLPRRGPETDFRGRLWASRDDQGAVYRLDIDGGAHFLLQNGPRARVWRAEGGRVGEAPLAEPLIPGLEITAFDVLRPYLYWPVDGKVTVTRVRGRPADVFFFKAPPGAGTAGVAEVRASLDSEYHAPLEVASLGSDGHPLRTFTLLDLRKTGSGEWLPKDLDIRDEASRNKTRLTLAGAALDGDFAAALFSPSDLSAAVSPPGAVERW